MPINSFSVQATLVLPPENEYGCRPELSRTVLDRYLRQAGLQSVVFARPGDALPGLVATMRAVARDECSGLAMFSIVGADLPGLVPSCLDSYPVWYFTLPAGLWDMAPALPRGRLSVYGGLTEDPWRNAVFIALCTDAGGADAADRRLVAFPEANANASLAYQKGFALLIFDCEDVLYLGAVPIGEELILDLQVCESDSFQRPTRHYSVEYLQERTRIIEAGGEDPEGLPGGGNHIARVFQLERCGEPMQQVGQDLGRQSAPLVRWCASTPSVVGRLSNIASFLEDFHGVDGRLRLKVSLTPEQHEAARNQCLDARVQRVSISHHEVKAVYALLLRFESELVLVALDAGHPFMTRAYEEWVRRGECALAFENCRNGRLSLGAVPWPSQYAGELSAGTAPHVPANRLRGVMHAQAAVRALAEAELKANTRGLTCFVCDAVDELELWQVAGL